MSNAPKYITESLGSCGFAVLRGQVAYTQRPDLWAHGLDASHDFADKSLPGKLNTFSRCSTYLARFEGVEGASLIKVLARSPDQLAQRIEWVTGFKATVLVHESEMAGEVDRENITSRPKPVYNGDLHAGVVTAEPGRPCFDCERFSAARSCSAEKESLIQFPAPNVARRCQAYKPHYQSHDGRTGAQLWPELAALKTITQ